VIRARSPVEPRARMSRYPTLVIRSRGPGATGEWVAM
jgi:hypothetical protein